MRSDRRRPRAQVACLFGALTLGCSAAPAPEAEPVVRRAEPAKEVRYCHNIAWTRTNVECIGPVPEEAVAHRDLVHKLTLEDGKTVLIEKLSGAPGNYVRRTALTYDGDEIREERVHNRSGAFVVVGLFEPGGAREHLLDDKGRPSVAPRPMSGIGPYQMIDIERDARGFETRQRWWTVSGKPATNAEGVHDLRTLRDERGLETETRAFDAEGRPIGHGDGAHRHVMKHDANGRLVRLERYDQKARPFAGRWQAAVMEVEYDSWGNEILDREIDASGRIVRELRETRDDRGFLVQKAYVDADGKPIENHAGVARYVQAFDDGGLVTRQEWFGADGALKHVVEAGYDSRDRQVTTRWFSPTGEPKGGYDYEIDDRDNVTRSTVGYGKGRLGVTFSVRFDDRGRPTERKHLDPKGAIDDTQQCPRVSYAYDPDGLSPTIKCHDRSGNTVDVVIYQRIIAKTRALADQAAARLRAGERFRDVAAELDFTQPYGETAIEQRILRTTTPDAPFWGAMAKSSVGDVVGPVEVDKQFWVGLRER